MPQIPAKPLNLPYIQHDRYWISLFADAGTFPADISEVLAGLGCKKTAEGVRTVAAPKQWAPLWSAIYGTLQRGNLLASTQVEITSDENASTPRKSPDALQVIARNLWLGEAVQDERLVCYFQPIMGRAEKIFGYESFARVRSPEGGIIAGDQIIAASKALGIEFSIDRQLHVQAIQSFAASDFAGFLFINFFPGFIQRPAVYLEGLSEAAQAYSIIPKNLVLELTRAETQGDIKHLKNVCDYGRSKGYSIALDDIETLQGASKLVPEIRPDFVKVNMQPNSKINAPHWQTAISQIVELVHAHGGTVIGEGVETDEAYQQLKNLGVDLFQGYLFSPPAPVVRK